MFRSASLMLLFLLSMAATVASAQPAQFQNIGRTATPQEIKAWDIDVRPDFKGLPAGQGSVKQGEVVWDAQCQSCHGHFGESAAFFTPIAGGTTVDDVKTGRVKSLLPGANQPQRTTLMKLSSLSTLWDYINRAMPWNSPKSLTADEVYAVTAYILNLGDVLPADFVLSNQNMPAVQAMLPNRNGKTAAHGLWPGSELGGNQKPDVQGSSCMKDCGVQTAVKSTLPDYAKTAHGNLADQSRSIGPSRGLTTGAAIPAQTAVPNSPADQSIRAQAAPEKIASSVVNTVPKLAHVKPLLDKNACTACHGLENKLVGPSFKDVAARYKNQADAATLLAGKIKNGSQGVWGAVPMPAQALSVADSAQIAQWLAAGMPE
jgi:S-disulfanyl-L-cysteine oxidoreductase SoxD